MEPVLCEPNGAPVSVYRSDANKAPAQAEIAEIRTSRRFSVVVMNFTYLAVHSSVLVLYMVPYQDFARSYGTR